MDLTDNNFLPLLFPRFKREPQNCLSQYPYALQLLNHRQDGDRLVSWARQTSGSVSDGSSLPGGQLVGPQISVLTFLPPETLVNRSGKSQKSEMMGFPPSVLGWTIHHRPSSAPLGLVWETLLFITLEYV